MVFNYFIFRTFSCGVVVGMFQRLSTDDDDDLIAASNANEMELLNGGVHENVDRSEGEIRNTANVELSRLLKEAVSLLENNAHRQHHRSLPPPRKK